MCCKGTRTAVFVNVSINSFARPKAKLREDVNTDMANLCKRRLDFWDGHFSQVLISTIDGSKH